MEYAGSGIIKHATDMFRARLRSEHRRKLQDGGIRERPHHLDRAEYLSSLVPTHRFAHEFWERCHPPEEAAERLDKLRARAGSTAGIPQYDDASLIPNPSGKFNANVLLPHQAEALLNSLEGSNHEGVACTDLAAVSARWPANGAPACCRLSAVTE